MLTPKALFCSLAVAGLMAAQSFGQVDDQAKQILEQSAQAIRDTKSVSYTARRFYTGPLEGLLNISGEVKIFREEPAKVAYWAEGELGLKNEEETRFTVFTDGEVVEWLDWQKNVLRERGKTDREARQQTETIANQVLLEAYKDPMPYEKALKSERIAHAGIEEIDGVKCDVIEAGSADGTRKTVYHIGVADRLPRREAMVNESPSMSVAQVLELSQFQVNPQFAAADLKLEAPDGFVEDRRPTNVVKRDTPPVAQEPAPSIGPEQGAEAPEFTLASTDGSEISLSDFQDKVVVITFWGTKFTQSVDCLDTIEQFHKELADPALNIQFLTVACREDSTEAPAATMADKGHTLQCLVNGDEVAASYGVYGFPSTCFVGRNGTVSGFIQGCPTEKQLWDELNKAAEAQ